MNLRPYQKIGVEDIFAAWKQSRIVFYVSATGTGKTVVFTEVVRRMLMRGFRSILIAHRTELIDQAHKTLYRAQIFSGIIQGSRKTDFTKESQVCSIQTITRRANLPEADVIIIDEGHHVEEKNGYADIMRRFPNAFILMVSALPYRLDGKGFRHIIQGEETKLVLNMPTDVAIREGWLTPMRYIVASVPDFSEVGIVNGDYDDEEAVKALNLAPIVQSYKDYANGLQGLVFAQTVAHSEDLRRQYIQQGIPSEHVDGETPDEDYKDPITGDRRLGRKSIISDFNCGLVKAVTNYQIFVEGTDFPNCEFVQLAYKSKSLSKMFQSIGRGLRPADNIKETLGTLQTAFERQYAIAMSSKTCCVVLDNSGMYFEHGGAPDVPRNLEYYFNGWSKPKKKVGDMEMLVWVAEDTDGRIVRTKNPNEVVGMKMIEVTKEIRQKVITLKSLKEFDKICAKLDNIRQMKKPGYAAVEQYIDYCDKRKELMVPEIWDYIHRKLKDEIVQRERGIEYNRERSPEMYPGDMYERALKDIQRMRVSGRWIMQKRDAYYQDNADQLAKYAASKMNRN